MTAIMAIVKEALLASARFSVSVSVLGALLQFSSAVHSPVLQQALNRSTYFKLLLLELN